MAYMMSGRSRRGLGFKIDMNTVYSGAEDSQATEDSSVGSDITTGLSITAKTNSFFTEGVLSDIADSVQKLAATVAAGTDERADDDQINTQGSSDEQLASDATAKARGADSSSRQVKKQPAARSIEDILPESLQDSKRSRDRRGSSKDALDKAKAARAGNADNDSSSEKKKSVQAQTRQDEAEGIPPWVWLVAAGAVVFAVYGRKK